MKIIKFGYLKEELLVINDQNRLFLCPSFLERKMTNTINPEDMIEIYDKFYAQDIIQTDKTYIIGTKSV